MSQALCAYDKLFCLFLIDLANMKEIQDKFIPIICIVLAIIVAGSAYFLWSTKIDGPLISDEIDFGTSIFARDITNSLPADDDIMKVLIVPGHDNEFRGAEYYTSRYAEENEDGIFESDLTISVGLRLYEKILSGMNLGDNNIDEVYIVRDQNNYTETFQNYFAENYDEIARFKNFYEKFTNKKSDFDPASREGEIAHISAPEEVSIRLNGINRWANENDIDIVLHLHFNDYPGRGYGPGKYSGFSFYIPHASFQNYRPSRDLAEKIRHYIQSAGFAPSNLEVEEDIIIEDSDLIAIGAHDSLESASVLIEYGYIYERQFLNETAEKTFDDLASLTYSALLEFLSNSSLATE
jgi:N-acetylmuramoyl-L-alanine amidase